MGLNSSHMYTLWGMGWRTLKAFKINQVGDKCKLFASQANSKMFFRLVYYWDIHVVFFH